MTATGDRRQARGGALMNRKQRAKGRAPVSAAARAEGASQRPVPPLEGDPVANQLAAFGQITAGWIEGIEEGATQEARCVLEVASWHLKLGMELPAPIATFLAERIDNILSAGEPWGVPLLQRTRGQKDPALIDRNREIAFEYWCYTQGLGWKGTAALAEVSEKFGVSQNAVKHAWRTGRARIESLDPDYLSWLKEVVREEWGEGAKPPDLPPPK